MGGDGGEGVNIVDLEARRSWAKPRLSNEMIVLGIL